MSRICQPIANVGPKIGAAQSADSRICLAKMNVSPRVGDSGVIIIYGAAGSITFGAAGEIIY